MNRLESAFTTINAEITEIAEFGTNRTTEEQRTRSIPIRFDGPAGNAGRLAQLNRIAARMRREHRQFVRRSDLGRARRFATPVESALRCSAISANSALIVVTAVAA